MYRQSRSCSRSIPGGITSPRPRSTTLGLFARNGLIKEVIVDPTRVFYDPNTLHHHHFYNVDTGELMDIDAAQLALGELPELPEGTTADGVDVIIRLRNKAAVN